MNDMIYVLEYSLHFLNTRISFGSFSFSILHLSLFLCFLGIILYGIKKLFE